MQSLQTTVKRDAEKLSRGVSVQFDLICHEARLKSEMAMASASLQTPNAGGASDSLMSTDEVMARIPALIRQAASRVVEEQLRDPKHWRGMVTNWQSFYESMKVGEVPKELQRPAIEAQAILNGIELALRGESLPPEPVEQSPASTVSALTEAVESWENIRSSALALYGDKVGSSRYRLAQRRLPEIKVTSIAVHHVQAGLLEWCKGRLKDVKPRTVKTQLDCMVSALRCVVPTLKPPVLKELQGVMQARTNDRQSMPVQAIREAIEAFNGRPASVTTRNGYGGGASQFDAIAVEALAILGMRPRELVQAKTDAIREKEDVFGVKGLYFRIVAGKNKASERDIPLSDATREVIDISRLRQMLTWQQDNPRSLHGAVSSFGARFKKMTKGYTLYQMRHSWKDVAVNAGVDSELRELLMGHKVRGVSAVYGSGIPLAGGVNALLAVRKTILGEMR